MRGTNSILIVCVLILVALVANILISLGIVGGAKSQQWEYYVDSVEDAKFEEAMGRIGARGWEAFSARRATGGGDVSYEILFKRPTSGKPVTPDPKP